MVLGGSGGAGEVGAETALPVDAEPPDAFISYAREQQNFVRRLDTVFQERGKSVWVDWKDIPPTADWRAEVRAAIDEAHAFVFVLSRESLDSEICEEELVHAVGNDKRIVPVVVADIEAEKVPKELAARNWIFCRPRMTSTPRSRS